MIGFLLKQSLYRIKIVHGRADRNMSYPAFWITVVLFEDNKCGHYYDTV